VPTTCELYERLDGDSVTAGAVPVPLNDRLCGLFEASSVTETLAERLPDAEGENVTVIVHDALTARVEGEIGHVFVWL